MIDQQQYVVLSLELHMFFSRIMKEHAIFLEAGFTPVNPDYAKVADEYKEHFETILYNAFMLGNGIISPNVATSGEIVTDYTLGCEQKTQNFVGIAINHGITQMQSKLYGMANPQITPELVQKVRQLNASAKVLVDGIIAFKAQVLDEVLSCHMFTVNYPLLIDHIRREAKTYRDHLAALESNRNPDENIKETELFWDQIMMEHAQFIRGLLDPSENELINTSNDFAREYDDLLQAARTATDMTMPSITNTTLQQTVKYRDFKEAGTKGIAECRIRSIILPLLADHVLRESNHYIRLLRQFE